MQHSQCTNSGWVGPASVMDDDRLHYLNGTGWLAIFTDTETVIGRTADVDAWDEATGVAVVVDP